MTVPYVCPVFHPHLFELIAHLDNFPFSLNLLVMKIRNLSLVVLLLSLFTWNACQKNTKPKNDVALAPEVETQQFRKQQGTDCDSVYEDRTNCAYIDFQYPVVAAGSQALKDSVAKYVNGYLIGILTGGSPEENVKAATLEEGAKVFFDTHKGFEGSAMYGGFTASSGTDVIRRDSQYLSIAISGDTYQGGAHGSQTSLFATFDVITGHKLTWDDVVNDKAALKMLAESFFRRERADIFREGFEFDETFQFALPQNFALAESGIYCQYDPYEVAPYAMGSTNFVLPYREMDGNLKVAVPAFQAEEPAVAAEDIYQMNGGQVVIPTFEVEVRTSQKAGQLLQKKKETIIVAAMFYGFPISGKDADETGQMGILNKDIEMSGSQHLARFEGLKFSKTELDKLKDKDLRLLINVFSGRKSSENNLLSCGLADVPASQFGGKRYSIQCNLIEESPEANDGPTISYALPREGEEAPATLPISVDCNERGEIFWLGDPVKDMEALMANLRPVLEYLKKSGAKALPGIQTNGCMMGMQGAIRDAYDVLKNQFEAPAKSTLPAESSTESAKLQKNPLATITAKSSTAAKATAPAAKPTASKDTTPTVTLNQKGEITLDGKKVTLDNLRKELQAALLKQAVIPDKMDLKTTGETGMGMRAEVNTLIHEALSGAKWARKKAAMEALGSSVGKKLGVSVKLEPVTYRTGGTFSYMDANLLQQDGKAIDYSKTTYKKQHEAGKMTGRVLGLLQFENGAWKVLTYNLESDKAPVDSWVKTYQAPKSLFGK